MTRKSSRRRAPTRCVCDRLWNSLGGRSVALSNPPQFMMERGECKFRAQGETRCESLLAAFWQLEWLLVRRQILHTYRSFSNSDHPNAYSHCDTKQRTSTHPWHGDC